MVSDRSSGHKAAVSERLASGLLQPHAPSIRMVNMGPSCTGAGQSACMCACNPSRCGSLSASPFWRSAPARIFSPPDSAAQAACVRQQIDHSCSVGLQLGSSGCMVGWLQAMHERQYGE